MSVNTAENTEAAQADPGPRKLTPAEVKVLSVALAAKQREGWCDSGFNTAMRELGLPEIAYDTHGGENVTVEVPTSGTVCFTFPPGTDPEQALMQAARYASIDRNANRLEYGRRGAPLEFDFTQAKVTGLDDGVDKRSPEKKQWDAALAQVQAYREGTPDAASAESDVEDD